MNERRVSEAAPMTQSRLLDVLFYDQDTGIFTWRKRIAMCVHVGSVAGWVTTDGYLSIRIDGRNYRCHRLAWLYVHGVFPKAEIDHINGIKTDNRIKNLREAKSHSEQQQNRKLSANNTSGFPGVCFHKSSQRWDARIAINGERHHLGTYVSPEEAGNAYREAKKRLHKFCPKVRDFSYKGAAK